MHKPAVRFDSKLKAVAKRACCTEGNVASVDFNTDVVIPQRTIRRPTLRFAVPPIGRMVAVAGGAGDIRVRLYLWLWAVFAARQQREATYRRTTGQWAELLNLIERRSHREERAKGARRVSAAIRYLQGQGLIDVPFHGGITLLDPDGTQGRFIPWTDQVLAEREQQRDELRRRFGEGFEIRRHPDLWEDEPLRLPLKIWVNGTVSVLSGRALAVLLVLWNFERNRSTDSRMFPVPKVKRTQFGLANDIWHKGLRELEAYGCIVRKMDKSCRPVFDKGVNSRVPEAVFPVLYRIEHQRVEGLRREQLPV